MKAKRDQYTNAIVDSVEEYRIIAAGPGTGKSYTMLQILKKDPSKKYLVLTLTNELINDLNATLGAHAECQTFHSLALDYFKKEIAGTQIVYPQLDQIIEDDSKIIHLGANCAEAIKDFASESDDKIITYINRANYYEAIDFDLMVYKVCHFLIKDQSKIRIYDLVLIDEFQDFNKLETELVNILEQKNAMIIVGDDDQSIYSFRGARPQFLRDKYAGGKFATYTLPYCSRCTDVIVSNVNAIIHKATKDGIMKDRILKDYQCYTPDKADDSKRFPKIMHTKLSVQDSRNNLMGEFIHNFYNKINIAEIQKVKEDNKTLILIIGQSNFLMPIHQYLTKRLPDICIEYKKKKKNQSKIIFALKLLSKKQATNLAWRIIADKKLSNADRNKVIKKSISQDIGDLISGEVKQSCTKVIDILENADPEIEEQNFVMDYLNVSEYQKVAEEWKKEISAYTAENEISGVIKFTSFEGCKGLAADYVFIVGLHETVLPKKEPPSETDVCKFIVALTRTKKQCHILTCQRYAGVTTNPSCFIKWLSSKDVSHEYIDAQGMKALRRED